MPKYPGSCLCQKTHFEVTGDFIGFYLCHCSRCRKVTGSAHGANLFSKNGELKWTSGEELVKLFKLPETRFAKAFCSCCGSALPWKGPDNRIVVPAGSLDCDVETKPSGHIFIGSKANWDKDFESVIQFEELPNKK